MSSMIDLPDFDDMAKRIDQIRVLMFKKLELEAIIDAEEAEISTIASTNSKYFINNKPPSMSYIKSAYLPAGFDGSLLEKRKELASIVSDLEHQKNLLDLEKTLIDIWRTQSANERKAVL